MPRALQPHPASPSSPVRVGGEAGRAGGVLTLSFTLVGDLDAVRLPPAGEGRVDELWRETCLEAFVQTEGAGAGYLELNLSPSGQWAAYAFDAYRTGMRDADVRQPMIQRAAVGDSLSFEAELDLSAALEVGVPWRVSLAAVIEESDGAKSYWALAHGGEAPDFHDSAGFVLTLPA